MTRKQLATLVAFDGLARENGIAPTLAELAAALGISRTSTHERLERLVDKGYITESAEFGAQRARKLTPLGVSAAKPHRREALIDLRRAWKRASEAERAAFCKEIGA